MTSTQRQAPPHLARLNLQGHGPIPNGPGTAPLFSPAVMQTPMNFTGFPMPGAPQRPSHRANQASIQLAAAGIMPPPPLTAGIGGHFPRPSMLGGGSFNLGEPQTPHAGQQNWQQKRKNRQLSVGGPPKAVLGGPAAQRKSPIPPGETPADEKKEEEVVKKVKKVIVKLPKETIREEGKELGEDEEERREPWARFPMALPMQQDSRRDLGMNEMTSRKTYPEDSWKYNIPDAVDVFLPGRDAWQRLKNRDIEEKLERLGVTAGSGTTTTTNGGPALPALQNVLAQAHGRANSISSPADPALLLRKLSALQSAQANAPSTASPGSSLTSSPAPPSWQGHGHSQSMAASTNPFGPYAHLGSDSFGQGMIHAPHARAPLNVPNLNTARLTPPTPGSTNSSSLAPPPMSAVGSNAGRPSSKPDFIRGFGLELEEVAEEDEGGHTRQNSANLLQTENWVNAHSRDPSDNIPSWGLAHSRKTSAMQGPAMDEEEEEEKIPSWGLPSRAKERNNSTLRPESPSVKSEQVPDREHSLPLSNVTDTADVAPLPSFGSGALSHPPAHGVTNESLQHSRHVSKLSAALSLRSVGGVSAELEESRRVAVSARDADGDVTQDMSMDIEMKDDEAVNEWTGTDDDTESIGSYSNPSDEERARKERIERRRRRSQHMQAHGYSTQFYSNTDDTPRRLPNFPRPPDNTMVQPLPRRDDDDFKSNPSDEGVSHGGPTRDYLGVALGNQSAMSEFNFHSRDNSTFSLGRSTHDPANAHSRVQSGNSEEQQFHHEKRPSFAAPLPALNPFAKPFVFGGKPKEEVETPAWFKSTFGPPQPVSIKAADPSRNGPGQAPNAPQLGHTRLPSFGKPLNAAASEFKPTSAFGIAVPAAVAATSRPLTFNPAAQEFKPTLASKVFVPNPGASEFKPGFTFRPPPGGPSMPPPPAMPAPVVMPVPQPASIVVDDPMGFEQQHREKRVRRSEEEEDRQEDMQEEEEFVEGESIASFKFPNGAPAGLSPLKVRNVGASNSDQSLKPAEPFSLANFNKRSVEGMPQISPVPVPDDRRQSLTMSMALHRADESPSISGSEIDEEDSENIPPPDTMAGHGAGKTKRAPIPLDFRHPVSRNTVPAGLFKALANGSNGGQGLGVASPQYDDKTRHTVRSRLSSRDAYEQEHRSNPSLDDLNVPGISLSHKASAVRLRDNLVGSSPTPVGSIRQYDEDEDDVFTIARPGHVKRRSSLPDGLGSGHGHSSRPQAPVNESLDISYGSEFDGAPVSRDLATKLEMQQYERRLAAMLDEKIVTLRNVASTSGPASLDPATENMIAEAMSLFRMQLQESAAKSMSGGLDDSQADARGEIDFEIIKDMVKEGHDEARMMLQRELNDLVQRLAQVQVSAAAATNRSGNGQDFSSLMEQLNVRTLNGVVEAVRDSTGRLEAVTRSAVVRSEELVVERVSTAMRQLFQMMRELHAPVDYDALTSQLTQAVKPHISQLIDLASDKRETAGLIVEQILPLLPRPSSRASDRTQPALDTDALVLQLTQEVRRAIAPIDAFEIKEQVADLVIERLDSRLANRDKHFNVETVSTRVSENVAKAVEPLSRIVTSISALQSSQEELADRHSGVTSSQAQLLGLVSALPSQFATSIEELKAIQASHARSRSDVPQAVRDPSLDANMNYIKSVIDSLVGGQRAVSSNTESILGMHSEILERFNSLPEVLANSTNSLQAAHNELEYARETHKREVEELRRSNTEYQVNLAKARGAHGQVRVEKDSLAEKLKGVESERDRARNQLQEADAATALKASEMSSLEARNGELQDALAQALSRLQASDVAQQSNNDRIVELEKSNRELISDKQALKSKVDSLELQVTFASRDKDTATEALTTLQKQHDQLTSQQDHWDSLRAASDQIQTLTELIGQADNAELNDLRRARDRFKVLEGEHSALQKRFKEQESKISNSEKIAFTARQSLTQATQRAADWERRATEYQGQLELVQTKLDQSEQMHATLDADHSLAKLQLDEREADMRLATERERRSKEQISSLEDKVRNLQNALVKAQTANGYPSNSYGNGSHTPVRPDSRSTVYIDSRSVTPTGGFTPPNNKASVWDSMHAPSGNRDSGYSTSSVKNSIHAPSPVPSRYPGVGQKQASNRRNPLPRAPPSPTFSTVSATPTQGEDGWWS